MKYLLALLFFVSCASFEDYRPVKNGEDYYKLKNTMVEVQVDGLELTPLRDEAKNLITNEDRAKKRLSALGSLEGIKANIIETCSADIEKSERYLDIIKLLQAKKAIRAREELESIKSLCENMEYQSHYFYLLAYSFQLEGNQEQRDKHLKLFIQKADRVFPYFTQQEDSRDEQVTLYRKYKAQAQKALNGEKVKLNLVDQKHLQVPRYPKRTNSMLPGFENEDGRVFFIFPSYSTAFGGGIDGFYNFNTEYGELITIGSFNNVTGFLASLVYRKQISATLNRKHQTGVNIKLSQWKKAEVTRTFNTIVDSKIIEEGVGGRVGYGGTYQFDSHLYGIYQAAAYSQFKNGTLATAMLGYSFSDHSISGFEFGLFDNRTVIGYRLSYILFQYIASGNEFVSQFNFSF